MGRVGIGDLGARPIAQVLCRVTPGPHPRAADIWSWHHTFTNGNATVDVLVDVDGNNVMDTEHAWLRVVVRDIEVVYPGFNNSIVWIRDSTGRRFAVGTGWQMNGPVHHVALATPIVLTVGSSLSVGLQGRNSTEVDLIGRVVNL